ncbi:MAG: hypothetical protein ACOVP6_04765, partial [Lacibacter sp.]
VSASAVSLGVFEQHTNCAVCVVAVRCVLQSGEALAAFSDAVSGHGYTLQHKEDLQALRERAVALGGVDELEEVAGVALKLKLIPQWS